MCLIVFAWHVHPDFPLVLGANRDEFLDRPTRAAQFWPDHPELLAGRDLKSGGTWLGITRSGRVAAVTNFRQGTAPRAAARSRGLLVSGFLTGNNSPAAHLDAVAKAQSRYDGFNLLAGDGRALHYFSNRDGAATLVEPGVHGLSNALLDTPWPKVERAKSALTGLLDHDRDVLVEGTLRLLADQARPPDHELPSTGVSLEWERCLSSVFIAAPGYGTRSSTVLLIDRGGHATFCERSFDHAAGTSGDVVYEVDPT
ncbi:MAG: NRDE family protein [Burkholderiales bacterium]